MPGPAVPPGWPDRLAPPDSPDWETAAVAWLLDRCPPDYRGHPVLRAQPVVLARLAVECSEAALQGARRGRATLRADLADRVAPEVLTQVVTVYDLEGRRLAAQLQQVRLVEQALRGERHVPRL